MDEMVQTRARPHDGADPWMPVPHQFRHADGPLPRAWDALYGPLRTGCVDDLMVVAQLGQSIDGRITTDGRHPTCINGTAGLDHLHRLRALVDAVVVGVGTAVSDDPQLTVRRVAGPNPARVVIDPRGRLAATARLLRADGARRIIVTGDATTAVVADGIEVMHVALTAGIAAPSAILAGLRQKGFRRILVEGGARTISEFLAAGCLDRLHVMVAPMLVGAGQPSLCLPPGLSADGALRPPVTAHLLDGEVLFDIDLSARRRAL
jgi:riboflavin-specific deaminase-like protein